MKNSKNMGIFYIICSAFCFSCMNLFVRLAGNIPSIQKSFFRNLIAFLFALIILRRNKISNQLHRNTIIPLLVRSIAGTIGVLCNFYAVDHLAIADASMLNKLSPFFVIIFSFIILKEKVALYQTCCIIVAFIGALFVMKPSVALFHSPASLVGMFGGICAGLAYAFVRICSQRDVKGPFIVAFFSGFSCISVIPFIITNYTPMNFQQFIILICAGLAAAGGQFSITAAYSYAPGREISVYDYSQIIFSTILGLLFLHELPDIFSFIGYGIIITASVVMFLFNNRHHEV